MRTGLVVVTAPPAEAGVSGAVVPLPPPPQASRAPQATRVTDRHHFRLMSLTYGLRRDPIVIAGTYNPITSKEEPMPLDRRAFLASLAAGVAAPAILRAAPARKRRYPIAFSTLGCPAWSWSTILEQADTLGYSALELRGVAGEMDLTKVPELSGTRLAETRRELESRGLVVSDLGSSAHMHEKDAAAREKQEADGRRFI